MGVEVTSDAFSIANEAQHLAQGIGEKESIWFKLAVIAKQTNPIETLARLSKKYGGCIPVNLKGERIFFLSDVEHFKHVLVTKVDNYDKYFDGLKPIFGNSMITIDGTLWQKIRLPQRAAFHPKMFGEYVPYFMSSIDDMKSELDRFCKTGDVINLLEETWGLAASMICKALFDRDVPFNPREIFNAVKAYTDVVNHREIRLRKVRGELVEVSSDESAAEAIASWISVPSLILGAVPRDHREQTLLTILQNAERDPLRPEFDAQQVIDEIKQYLWAGTETTALTLTWCLYLLHQHPEVADRIRQEGETVYGDRMPDWNDIQALSYTRSVIQETMRLYPPIWSFMRIANQEDEISGHSIKVGDKIALCAYIVHHSEQHWENPEAFDPSRFDPENMNRRAPYSYLPFAAGKRACIGGALSIVENTLALTQLLRYFRFEYVGDMPAKMSATVTLTPEGGNLPFRVHRAT